MRVAIAARRRCAQGTDGADLSSCRWSFGFVPGESHSPKPPVVSRVSFIAPPSFAAAVTRRALASVVLVAAVARAQTVVAGRVVEQGKRTPVRALTVELLGGQDSVLQASTTSADGTFTLLAPQAGTYRVRFVDRGMPTSLSDSLHVSDGEYFAREFLVDLSRRPFGEAEVDKPALPAAGSRQPRYPRDLLKAGVSGCALVQFVVDTTGGVELSTVRVLSYSRPEFARAVYDAAPAMRFVPAEHEGRKVRQLLQQPFTFSADGHEWECRQLPPPR